MFSIVIVTHGHMAEAMRESAAMIVGNRSKISPVCVTEGDAIEEVRRKLVNLFNDKDKDGKVVVLSDFPIGTPFNVICSCMREYDFIHITGANMPLLLSLLEFSGSSEAVDEVCKKALGTAKKNLFDVGKFLNR